MKPGLISTMTFLLATTGASAKEDTAAGPAPAAGPRPSENQAKPMPVPDDCELRGQAALGLSVVGLAAFLLGFLAIGWMLSFVSFIAAGMVLLDRSRGRYWPARLALGLSMIFVLGLLAFVMIYS
jgi:hypothetical protein